jgi:cold shock CspA family protein
MRTHGTLVKWNDDRGFGFLALPQNHEEIFVHITAFPKDGVRPRIGELVSFEVRIGPNGRKEAVTVERPRARATPVRQEANRSESNRSFGGLLISGVATVAIGFAGYNSYVTQQQRFTLPAASSANETTQSFRCDGRTHCSQMTSCAEARYFLNHCPAVKMDGDGGGVPCERQWCN